ncbi:DUF362 domain-containing protein [Methanofollis formosanus]|uniref:DUF362 domain-containing protein n=1 Tax=Methanofollis formosanus TaxID=299308 RepID=A0A8G1EGM1_9EURY|nr:DUF362 domain-containing protein [Methanofollis formosanus]QYZ79067.1 DUF362 domain-containing protein [Methanofollis formosanus]
MSCPTVALARCPTYDEDAVLEAVKEVLTPFGGMEAYVRPGMRVLVKPNLLSAQPPERAVTTHPALVKAVVTLVRECGGTAVVGDSPGGNQTEASYRHLLTTTGMAGVVEETGCESVFFDDETMTVRAPGARTFRRFTVARAPLDADVVIALPKLKTHALTGYTGAVKLLYGFVPGVSKAAYHLHAGQNPATFADLLLDLHTLLRPTLSIMDAVVGMEGKGPQHGDPRKIGVLLASESCTALDYLAATLVGLDPTTLPTLARAAARGEGPGCLAEVEIVGPPLEEVRVRDFVPAPTALRPALPSFVRQLDGRLVPARPVVDDERCRRCGVCAEVCPPGAIVVGRDGLPAIDTARCIRCFCCQELCPEGAVDVSETYLREDDDGE